MRADTYNIYSKHIPYKPLKTFRFRIRAYSALYPKNRKNAVGFFVYVRRRKICIRINYSIRHMPKPCRVVFNTAAFNKPRLDGESAFYLKKRQAGRFVKNGIWYVCRKTTALPAL